MSDYYIPFTKEMKKTHTILTPNMLPIHFRLLMKVLQEYGYHADLLETSGPHIRETGLKYVHNDACYPAILVIGQFIDAIESGKYDPHKVALIYFQTGGGCRASNYISLLRKALERAGYGYVPVISFSLLGLEKHPGFKLPLGAMQKIVYAILYGDLILHLKNQVDPYEIEKGSAAVLADELSDSLIRKLDADGVSIRKLKDNMRYIRDAFAKIKVQPRDCIQVGIVGEIYVKFSPLGNNRLAEFLVNEGAEVTLAGLLDFFLYCTLNNVIEINRYGSGRVKRPVMNLLYKILCRVKRLMISIIEETGRFRPFAPFENTVANAREIIDLHCKMGEGWLLPAEMLELYHLGVKNIVCTQPFGCLPNHICGKGMMKPLKDRYPDMNIVAIDYDPGVTQVNLENRLKLMLANSVADRSA